MRRNRAVVATSLAASLLSFASPKNDASPQTLRRNTSGQRPAGEHDLHVWTARIATALGRATQVSRGTPELEPATPLLIQELGSCPRVLEERLSGERGRDNVAE